MADQPVVRRIAGFTLVELLVVMAIVGVMIALLLPAIQAARAASRRTHCRNNLKQVGVALANYHSINRQYPAGGRDYGWCQHPETGGANTIRNGNGLLLLLPFLELTALYDQFDHRNAAHNAMQGNNGCCAPTSALGVLLGDAVTSGNSEVTSQHLTVFTCPSDTGEQLLQSGGSATNYDFSASRNYTCAYWERGNPLEQRMFGENSTTRAASVTDGLSNTLALAETLRDVYNGSGPAWGYRTWVMVGIDVANKEINHWQRPPNPRRSQLSGSGHAGSLHGDGAHVLMADGSAHYILESTDATVREHLAAMADGHTSSLP